jgi:nucleoside-diphosphate-sugar epimerase
MLFESALPSDNRVQTVDVRDVAWACAAATTADVAREILLIAGDDSHRRCYGDLTPALVSALGMPGAVPPGRPGNPDSDDDWFVTDWMDTTRAQEALQFQHYSWPRCWPSCGQSRMETLSSTAIAPIAGG